MLAECLHVGKRAQPAQLMSAAYWAQGLAPGPKKPRSAPRPRVSSGPPPDLCPCSLPSPSCPAPGHLCRTRPTDLVFVVDSSRSVRPIEFEKVKVFLSQVIESLDVGPNATRVGVVNYASTVKQEFPLRAHVSKAALLQAVRRIQPLSTGTMTGLAIQFAITKAFSDAEGGRSRSPDISKLLQQVTEGLGALAPLQVFSLEFACGGPSKGGSLKAGLQAESRGLERPWDVAANSHSSGKESGPGAKDGTQESEADPSQKRRSSKGG
ncbi:hypothetical protein P7K49_015853 [Saguinus oedipus]|uniref:VWFA domain-containing protein n=1 Tax=Saguinus oedipus TaxID=9490 RepID=A0ABQ9VAE4_SAGOE|nr:hypothetical protein P7K49_015853 [Saguinus oedipus]